VFDGDVIAGRTGTDVEASTRHSLAGLKMFLLPDAERLHEDEQAAVSLLIPRRQHL
jgi:hypothetical protein